MLIIDNLQLIYLKLLEIKIERPLNVGQRRLSSDRHSSHRPSKKSSLHASIIIGTGIAMPYFEIHF